MQPPRVWRPRRAGRRTIQIAACLLAAACVYDPTAEGYQLVWQDDFNGTQLSTRWERHIPSQPPPQADELVVRGGTVRLRTTDPSRWTGITTRGPRQEEAPHYPRMLDWQEGYFEARVRYSDDAWSFPGVWLLSSAAAAGYPHADTHCPALVSEIDIVEGVVPSGHPYKEQRATHTLHRNTQMWADDTDGSCGQDDTPVWFETEPTDPSDPLHHWHVWGARWTSTEVCWFVDRQEIGCKPTFDSTAQPMHIILSTAWYDCRRWLYPYGCPPRPAHTELEVDWVRVWQK